MRNIFAAMPGCERMPAPISDTFARSWSSSTSIVPSTAIGRRRCRARAACTSSAGTENDSSAIWWMVFWMIVSTFTCSAATASNTAAAAPGRSGMPVSVNTTSFSLCVTAEMIAFSMPSSPIQVPCSSENVERA